MPPPPEFGFERIRADLRAQTEHRRAIGDRCWHGQRVRHAILGIVVSEQATQVPPQADIFRVNLGEIRVQRVSLQVDGIVVVFPKPRKSAPFLVGPEVARFLLSQVHHLWTQMVPQPRCCRHRGRGMLSA